MSKEGRTMVMIQPNGASLYGNFRTRTFSEIYPSALSFKEGYMESGITPTITVANAETLYYLLYARYGNSNIASSDENQFKYKVYSTIYMYGPAWQKRLEIQTKLMSLTEDDITKGSTAIHNEALNPGTSPSSQTLEELAYINSQNTTKYKKSKLEGYSALYSLIETDVTEAFIGKFKKLFITIVEPTEPLWYTEDIDNDY